VRKLRIGKTVDLLGEPQKIVEGKAKRDMVIRDLIVNLYPVLEGQKGSSLIITDTVLKIRNCKEEWIKLETHDYDVLKSALLSAKLLAWVETALVKAFEETEALDQKEEAKEKKEADG